MTSDDPFSNSRVPKDRFALQETIDILPSQFVLSFVFVLCCFKSVCIVQVSLYCPSQFVLSSVFVLCCSKSVCIVQVVQVSLYCLWCLCCVVPSQFVSSKSVCIVQVSLYCLWCLCYVVPSQFVSSKSVCIVQVSLYCLWCLCYVVPSQFVLSLVFVLCCSKSVCIVFGVCAVLCCDVMYLCCFCAVLRCVVLCCDVMS
jgi:hypothetical protein